MDPAQQPALAAIYAVPSGSTTLSPLPVNAGEVAIAHAACAAAPIDPAPAATGVPSTDDTLPATGGWAANMPAAVLGTAGAAAWALRRRAGQGQRGLDPT